MAEYLRKPMATKMQYTEKGGKSCRGWRCVVVKKGEDGTSEAPNVVAQWVGGSVIWLQNFSELARRTP